MCHLIWLLLSLLSSKVTYPFMYTHGYHHLNTFRTLRLLLLLTEQFPFLWSSRSIKATLSIHYPGETTSASLGGCVITANHYKWWRHQIETFSASLALCAGNSPDTGELPAQRPVTQRFDAFFDLSLNKQLSKQTWSWCFETPVRSLWRNFD